MTWNKENLLIALQLTQNSPALTGPLWELTGSNRRPSACKADALNQLSYAPFIFRSANIRDE